MYSGSLWLHGFHHTSHETALLTCCLWPNCQRGAFIHFWSRSELPWRSTFRKHFNRGSSIPPPHQWRPVSSLWPRRMGAYIPVSIIVLSILKPSNFPTLFLLSLEELCGAHIFTKLDLHNANNLVLHPKRRWMENAFVTPSGHYEYQVMPYGISNSPCVFQNFMNEIFRDMLNIFVIVYMSTLSTMISWFTHPMSHNINVTTPRYSNASASINCTSSWKNVPPVHRSIPHLHHNTRWMLMDQGKVDTIRNWPQPTTVKKLQRFLGFAKFYNSFFAQYTSYDARVELVMWGVNIGINNWGKF